MSKQKTKVTDVIRHPSVFSDEIVPAPKKKKRALGVDFGNHCGYAFVEYVPDTLPSPLFPCIGIWNITPGEWDTGATRLLRLRQFLNVVLPDVIFYEDAKFNPPAEMLKGSSVNAILSRAMTGSRPLIALHAATVIWAEDHSVPTHGFSSTEIKRHALGRGRGNKAEMVAAANEKWGLQLDLEEHKHIDNAVDAAFALDLGMTVYMDGLR